MEPNQPDSPSSNVVPEPSNPPKAENLPLPQSFSDVQPSVPQGAGPQGTMPPPTVITPNSPVAPTTVSSVEPQTYKPEVSAQATGGPTPPESQAPQVFSAPDSTAGTMVTMPKARSSRKKLFAGVLALVVFLLSGGYVFAFYLPNRPSSVFKTGMDRSGQAFDKLVNDSTSKERLNNFKKSDFSLNVDAKQGESAYSGNFSFKFDPSNVDSSFSVTAKQSGVADKVLSGKILATLPEGSTFPSIYFQLSGIKSFGLDAMLPSILQYDGKWISIDASYVESLGVLPPTTAADNEKKQLTADDVAEIARAAASSVNDYLLTSDTKKAVFVEKKFIGREKVDGIDAYHYKMGINKANGKAYCAVLVSDVVNTNGYKKLPGVDASNVESTKSELTKSCQDGFDSVRDSDDFDLWIDGHYKLVYKVRFDDSAQVGTYVEIGQLYKGSDELSMFVNYHTKGTSGTSDSKFSMDTNLKTNVSKGTLTVSGTESSQSFSVKATLDIKPYTGDLKIEKPAGTIPIQDVLKTLGLN